MNLSKLRTPNKTLLKFSMDTGPEFATVRNKPKSKNTQTRAWCFTLNNYRDKDVVAAWDYMEEFCRYAIFGFEYSEDGTPHIQGYFRVVNNIKLRYINCGGLFPLS